MSRQQQPMGYGQQPMYVKQGRPGGGGAAAGAAGGGILGQYMIGDNSRHRKLTFQRVYVVVPCAATCAYSARGTDAVRARRGRWCRNE